MGKRAQRAVHRPGPRTGRPRFPPPDPPWPFRSDSTARAAFPGAHSYSLGSNSPFWAVKPRTDAAPAPPRPPKRRAAPWGLLVLRQVRLHRLRRWSGPCGTQSTDRVLFTTQNHPKTPRDHHFGRLYTNMKQSCINHAPIVQQSCIIMQKSCINHALIMQQPHINHTAIMQQSMQPQCTLNTPYQHLDAPSMHPQ